MRLNKWFQRAAGMSLVCASVVSAAPLGGTVAPVVSAQAASDPGGEFHALNPTRIFDSRSGTSLNDVSPIGAKKIVTNPTGPAGEYQFNPLGKGGLPGNASDILAIVANVTVAAPTVDGWVATYPSDFEFGGPDGKSDISSLVNYSAGSAVANLVIVGLDSSGNLTINAGSSRAGSYHLIIDILGFVSTSQYAGTSTGARLELVDPGRILDTRQSTHVRAGRSISLDILGADTLLAPDAPVRNDVVPNRPNTVSAVLVNLTLVNNISGSQRTHVSATPELVDTSKFYSSSSNAEIGRVKANTTIVPVGADGSIKLFNFGGNVDLLVDVLGYFEEGIHANGNRGRIVPLEAPFRSFDTRGDGRLQHGSQEEWSFDNFVESVVLNPGAANEASGPAQQGLIGSLVAVKLQPLYASHAGTVQSSHLRLSPANATPAVVSNINFYLGQNVANMSLVKYGTSGDDNHVIEAYNAYGQIDYLLDVYAIVLDNE